MLFHDLVLCDVGLPYYIQFLCMYISYLPLAGTNHDHDYFVYCIYLVRTIGDVLGSTGEALEPPKPKDEAERSVRQSPGKNAFHLGMDTLAGVFRLSSTGVKGFGDAIFQAGSVGEELVSGAG